ncbi:MAG: toxin-antitoxin system YwqK family antitoxin [Bacteroidota bacterium]
MSFFREITRVPPAALINTVVLGHLLTLFMLLGFKAEEEDTTPPIAQVGIHWSQLQLNRQEGKWYYEGEAFNGYAVLRHGNGSLAEKTGFLNGKRQGPSFKWFENGGVSSEKNYVENRLEGIAKTWWPNGQQSTESNYLNRKRHGEQLKWYPSGQLARRNQFVHGKEEGLQQAWLSTGKLYANYEVKNGRFFGLRRSNLCYQLKDEVVHK